MSGFRGMDVGVVRAVGARLGTQAETLGQVVAGIDALVDEAVHAWDGPDAHDFRQWWEAQHRPSLLHAQESLAGLGRSALANADDQDVVSGGGTAGTGTLVPGAGAAGPSALGTWEKRVQSTVGVAAPVLEVLGFAASSRSVIGRYSNGWRAVQAWGDARGVPASVFRFKRSEVLQFLHPKVAPYARSFEVGGRVLAGTGVLLSGVDTARFAAHGDWGEAAASLGDTTASAMKMAPAGSPVWLGGTAVQAWTEVGRAAQQVDWSPQGMAEIRNASLGDWAGAFGDACTQMPGELVKIFG